MSRRSRAVLALVLFAASATGCATSRVLLDEPPLAGGSERFERSQEEVFQAALDAVDSVGLRVDEVVEWPGGGTAVLASRGWSWWDYGAIARVIVETAPQADGGSWVRVTSRLKMRTNVAGKSDYREDVFSAIHASLAGGVGESSPFPPRSMAARVTDPLTVGTLLRVRGVRRVVREADATSVVLDGGLGEPPARLTLDELAGRDVERLIREPYRGSRLLIGTLVGAALGGLMWTTLSDDGTPYGEAAGATYGVMFTATGVVIGAVWGNRNRTQWRPMR